MPAIDELFDVLLTRDASDLHLSPGYPALFRIRGELVESGSRPLASHEIATMIDELLTPPQRATGQTIY